jgi:hypothetical protein
MFSGRIVQDVPASGADYLAWLYSETGDPSLVGQRGAFQLRVTDAMLEEAEEALLAAQRQQVPVGSAAASVSVSALAESPLHRPAAVHPAPVFRSRESVGSQTAAPLPSLGASDSSAETRKLLLMGSRDPLAVLRPTPVLDAWERRAFVARMR